MKKLRACARVCAVVLAGVLSGCATPPPQPATPDALAQAVASRPIVLLGEVHDNQAQHALRVQALRRLIERGARPALAFEQFDRDRQQDLDAARAAPAPDAAARAARIIEAAGGRGWNWDLYRPYLELALQADLPIVAANLSRPQAMRVAQLGTEAVFDAQQRAALGLDRIPPELLEAQEREIEEGHCGRVPKEALAAMAAAQIARDATLAQSIAPYAGRGVVLLTGNGHARRDIGVARYLPERDRARAVSVGLLEDDEKAAARAKHYDVALLTPVQARPDPCASLSKPPNLPAP